MKTNLWTWIGCAFLVATQASGAQQHEIHADKVDTQNVNEVMARRVSAALKAVRSLDTPAYQEIYNLLMAERFEEFERRSKEYEARFQRDPLYESPLWKLYNDISTRDEHVLVKLDKWVKERPSYMSYCARGFYKENLGYFYRGDKYASETPKENFEKMAAVHREARADFMKALEFNKKFSPSYGGLLKVEMAMGSVEAADRIIKVATQEIPATYYVRHSYLMNIRPRWGGSYEAMQTFARSQIGAAKLNPRVWSLQAEAPAERGYSAWLNNDNQAALKYYTDALQYGDRMEYLDMRGRIYKSLKMYDLALRDFTQYREYDTTNSRVNEYISCLRLLIAGGQCPSQGASSSGGKSIDTPPTHAPTKARDRSAQRI